MLWLLAAFIAAGAAAVSAMSCNDAQGRCTFRTGCGTALNNYMLLCEEVLVNPSSRCPEPCQHALIALTSTVEGKELMKCRCDSDDVYCIDSKMRIEVCRPHVLSGAATNVTSPSCRLSQLICLADVQCNTALQYYHRFCRSVYLGRKCSKKCINSIEILRKQDKAAGLLACRCDGNEGDCLQMQTNMAKLCYHKLNKHNRVKGKKKMLEEDLISNEVIATSASCMLRTLPYLLQFIAALYCVFSAR